MCYFLFFGVIIQHSISLSFTALSVEQFFARSVRLQKNVDPHFRKQHREMVHKKKRVTKYTRNDDAFVYSSDSVYTYEDLKKLSVTKIQWIARKLFVPNISNTPKVKLIHAVVAKHNKRQSKTEETIETNTALDEVERFAEELQEKISQIRHYNLNGQLWYEATRVAALFDYEVPQMAICTHVDTSNEIEFRTIQTLVPSLSNYKYLHPQTKFINEKGIRELMYKSRMPKVTGKLAKPEYVYVATTALYQKKNIFKIGKTEDLQKRLNSLNNSHVPFDDMLFCYIAQCSDGLLVEKMVHALLDEDRVVKNREFFKLSLKDIISVIEYVCNNKK